MVKDLTEIFWKNGEFSTSQESFKGKTITPNAVGSPMVILINDKDEEESLKKQIAHYAITLERLKETNAYSIGQDIYSETKKFRYYPIQFYKI